MTKEKATKTTKNATRRARATRANSWDVCGFTRAINWEALDRLDGEELKALAKILDKVK